MPGKVKILVIRPWITSFIQQDLDLLEKHFNVKVIDVALSRRNVRRNVKGTLRTLLNFTKCILWADVNFSWFAGPNAFLAVLLSKIFRKKSIVVAGGYDVANEPAINYGVMRFSQSRSARIAKFALKHADKVLAVSGFNKNEALNYVNSDRIQLVYNAVDCCKFKPEGEKNENLVMTVGGVTHKTLRKKGLEVFVLAAIYLPDVRFMLVGRAYDNSIENLMTVAPSNVEFAGYVPFEELPKRYQKAKVYCQLSYHESFGLSLAEAMACECVPVTTNNAALPEVAGDTGFYVPYGDPESTAEAIKKALNSSKGKEARERIRNLFPVERRERELLEVINGLMSQKGNLGKT
ncbi:MAG: glycosyltransferase family 4 protein [Dehalococcoidia bacterium]|nr:glycosyltransferase family 4 protein [Dehalococcoidia bacterium]